MRPRPWKVTDRGWAVSAWVGVPAFVLLLGYGDAIVAWLVPGVGV